MDQVSQFEEYLAPKPYGAQWDSSNSLFATWIGINDVVRHDLICHFTRHSSVTTNLLQGNSYAWVNHLSGFHRSMLTAALGTRTRRPTSLHSQPSIRS